MTGSLTCVLLVSVKQVRVESGAYVGDGDGLIIVTAEVLKKVLDEDGALRDLAVDGHVLVVTCNETDSLRGSSVGRHGVGGV